MSRNGIIAISAAISPYEALREENRQLVESHGAAFVEVFCKCSLDELVRRDVKGLYKKALSGEIQNFTGVSDPTRSRRIRQFSSRATRKRLRIRYKRFSVTSKKMNLLAKMGLCQVYRSTLRLAEVGFKVSYCER